MNSVYSVPVNGFKHSRKRPFPRRQLAPAKTGAAAPKILLKTILDCRLSKYLGNEAVLDHMAERLSRRPDVLNQRDESVEHPFGTIKQWMNRGAFLMHGLDKVRGEFSLTALAYNIKRAITVIGARGLIGAISAQSAKIRLVSARYPTENPHLKAQARAFQTR